jgi:hypothetical protein
LGTLLAATLVAGARLNRQARRAAQTLDACQAADALVREFWRERDKFPRDGAGSVAGRDGWTWRTSARKVEDELLRPARIEVVRVEVFAPGASAGRPAAEVELVLPAATPASGPAPTTVPVTE